MVRLALLDPVFRHLNYHTSLVNSPPDSNKKKVLLIHCHPIPNSFSYAISKAVESGLRRAGHDIRIRRLYVADKPEESYNSANFEPALTTQERKSYHMPDMMSIRENDGILAKDKGTNTAVKQAISDLRWCDSIVFVYPTWWFNFPAALKGFFDRVLLPGVAFRITTNTSEKTNTGLAPGLPNIKKVGVVTTFGATPLVVLYAGDNGRRFISRGFRALCAPQCAMLWHGLHGMDHTTEAERAAFLKEFEDAYSTF